MVAPRVIREGRVKNETNGGDQANDDRNSRKKKEETAGFARERRF